MKIFVIVCRQFHVGLEDNKDVFAEPATFTRRLSLRKRKRRNSDIDSISVHSLDISVVHEPGLKRKKRLSRVASLATLLSPVRPVMKVGEALQRTWSGVKISSSPVRKLSENISSSGLISPGSSPPRCTFVTISTPPTTRSNRHRSHRSHPTPTRQRQARLWIETVAADNEHLSDRQIQHQEAIFELYQGEEDMVEDLYLVKKTYHDSLLNLNILTNNELQQIFGSMHTLGPLHQDLVVKLRKLRNSRGITENLGKVLIDWIPGLDQYISYCANQVYAKAMLDEKKTHDRRVEDFLQRCLESPFSRKLDLWNFLDVPRSRLVKYPLLFRNILKLTPEGHKDREYLQKAIALVEDIIHQVDEKMGESECKFLVSKLDFLEDKQRDPAIDQSKTLVCRGILRNNRGTKLHVFLFDKVLVLSRPVTRSDRGSLYQVYRQPIAITQLIVEDVKDGEAKMGSFRSAFSHGQSTKNVFRVSFCDPLLGQGHTLQASDEHDKKQWLQSLHKVLRDSGCDISSVLKNQDLNQEHRPPSRHSSTGSVSSLSSQNMNNAAMV